MPKLFILIPTFNRESYLINLLNSLNEQNFNLAELEIVVINDGSEQLNKLVENKNYKNEVSLLQGDGTLWWTGSINKGLKFIKSKMKEGDFVLLLNDDVKLCENYLNNIVTQCNSNENKIVGSVVLSDVEPERILDGGIIVNWWTAKFKNINYGKSIGEFGETYIKDVSVLTGRGVIFPAKVFKEIGLYNQNALPQHGDTEFTKRAADFGYRLVVDYNSRLLAFENSQPSKLKIRKLPWVFFDLRSKRNFKERFWLAKLVSKNTVQFLSFLIFDQSRLLISVFKKYCKVQMKKVLFLTEHLTSYRIPFFNLIEEQKKYDFKVLCGSRDAREFGETSETSSFRLVKFKSSYVGFGKFKFIWLKKLLSYIKNESPDLIIISNNLRWIQHIILFIWKKTKRYKILVWGHGVRSHSKIKLFRKIDPAFIKFLSGYFVDGFLVYTDLSKRYLKEIGIDVSKIHVFNNTIDVNQNRLIYSTISKKDNLKIEYITVLGRLTKTKLPLKAIQYWNLIKQDFPDMKLLYIGDGELLEELKMQSDDSVIFAGELFDENKIAEYMVNTKVVFSPGSSGLNIVHAFSYGKPFITFAESMHGPEIEYLNQGKNGYLFDSNIEQNVYDLKLLIQNEVMYQKFSENAWSTGSKLTIENMVDNFNSAFLN